MTDWTLLVVAMSVVVLGVALVLHIANHAVREDERVRRILRDWLRDLPDQDHG